MNISLNYKIGGRVEGTDYTTESLIRKSMEDELENLKLQRKKIKRKNSEKNVNRLKQVKFQHK